MSGPSCGTQDLAMQNAGSLFEARGLELSCYTACKILVPGPGLNPHPLRLQDRFLTPGSLGKFPTDFKMESVSVVAQDSHRDLLKGRRRQERRVRQSQRG